MLAQPCPPDNALLAFAEGLLTSEEHADIEGHLAQCSDCALVLGATYDKGPRIEYSSIGRYRVVDELGRGGMGRVLRAHDPALNRDVAIKLILQSALSTEARTRFLREARALGKLRHPNVVEIFDVGEVDGVPYFVMELVTGQNIDAWSLEKTPHEIMGSLRGAGRGLAAAHAAGILHRDFKPSNVLVDASGRAKVGDFGLSGAESVATKPEQSILTDSFTRTGTILGTLAYMAPELLDGGKATPASDQFAFCVAAHELLYGFRPYSGTNPHELCASIRAAAPPPPPVSIRVPRRVHQSILRGLRADPGDRFVSMQALLRALRPPSRARNLGLVVGVAGATLTASVVVFADAAQGRSCEAFEQRLKGVYDQDARVRVERALLRSDLADARVRTRNTLSSLDDYASGWLDAMTDACRATVSGKQSERALDQRMLCLNHHAQRLGATVELLASASNLDGDHMGLVVAALPELSLCSDTEALRRTTVLPADATQQKEAEELGPILSRAYTKTLVNDFDGAWALLQDHRDELAAASYPPVVVRTLQLQGRILTVRREHEEAQRALRRAHLLASTHGLDRDASRSATLLGVIASREGGDEKAQRWFDTALSRARAAHSTQLEAHTLATAAHFYADRGDFERAVDATGRALELTANDESYPPTSRAETLLSYAQHLFTRGGGDDGLAALEEAKEIVRADRGDLHPLLARVELALQIRASRRGDYAGSLAHAREAVRITTEVNAEGSIQTAAALVNLATALKENGQFQEALQPLQRVDAMLRARGKFDVQIRVPLLTTLGRVLLHLERNDAARDALTEAAGLLDTSDPTSVEQRIVLDTVLALLELRDGNLTTARADATRAVEHSVDVFGSDHFRVADARTRLAEVELVAGDHATARALLEGALTAEHTSSADRGKASFLLARALIEGRDATPETHRRALSLASQAEADLVDRPAYRRLHAQVRAWRREHPPR